MNIIRFLKSLFIDKFIFIPLATLASLFVNDSIVNDLDRFVSSFPLLAGEGNYENKTKEKMPIYLIGGGGIVECIDS